MTNFWKGLTKSEINSLIQIHKDVATMNEQQQKERKQEAAEALRDYLLEKEAEWWCRTGHIELFNDLCSKSFIAMTDGDIESITEEISEMAWEDPYAKAQLSLAQSQAIDGYNQAQQAFRLLTDIYYFLERLDCMHRLASWAARRVTEFKQRIEEFLPGLEEKHS